ncbi:alpha-ketoacid dehydrogenase subunit beta [Mycobacterium avium subsp. hominissuis]
MATATTTTTTETLRTALNQALHGAMERDPSVVVFGEDICDPSGGVMKVTEGLSTRFGNRVRDTPISEIAIGGAAVGAAAAGLRPVFEIMIMDFISIAMDQVQNHGAQLHYITNGALKVPLTMRVTCGAGSGVGATHSQSLETWLMHSPGFKVAAPSSPAEAKGLLTECIYDDDPCIFIEYVASYAMQGPVPEGEYRLPVGKANIARPGEDITLISYGPSIPMCLQAATELEKTGINAEVIDLRWLLPLDTETILASVTKTRRAVVVHQARGFLGPGAEIAALLQERLFTQLLGPVLRVAAPFVPVPASPSLEQAYFPSVADIVAAATYTSDNR